MVSCRFFLKPIHWYIGYIPHVWTRNNCPLKQVARCLVQHRTRWAPPAWSSSPGPELPGDVEFPHRNNWGIQQWWLGNKNDMMMVMMMVMMMMIMITCIYNYICNYICTYSNAYQKLKMLHLLITISGFSLFWLFGVADLLGKQENWSGKSPGKCLVK